MAQHCTHTTLHMLQVKRLHPLDLQQLQFVGNALTSLRQEVDGQVNLHTCMNGSTSSTVGAVLAGV